MPGNGKVFVSHAYQDNEACQPLLAALASWKVDYWFQAERTEADEALSPAVEQSIAERDIFLRVCSAASRASYWVRLESETFRHLREAERETGREAEGEHDGADERMLIEVSLDAGDGSAPGEDVAARIDATPGAGLFWRGELRRALGVAEPDPQPGAEADTEAGAETSEIPAVSSGEVLSEVMAWAQQLRDLHAARDEVVSVAIADRQGSATLAGERASCLVMMHGKEPGRTYQLLTDRVTLGRRRESDIFLEDLAVSRRHATVVRDPEGRFVLKDENSKNGTYVNGQSILEHVLADGDTIRLGQCVLQFHRPRNDD